jgi:hypothetical protein
VYFRENLKKPRWTVTPSEIEVVNHSPPRLQTPFMHLGGATSHDSIVFATKYAGQVFASISIEYRNVIEKTLDLFDTI